MCGVAIDLICSDAVSDLCHWQSGNTTQQIFSVLLLFTTP